MGKLQTDSTSWLLMKYLGSLQGLMSSGPFCSLMGKLQTDLIFLAAHELLCCLAGAHVIWIVLRLHGRAADKHNSPGCS